MNNRFNITEEEKNRIRGLHGIQVLNEQTHTFRGTLDDCIANGQRGNRETCVDYILRNFMHIGIKPGSFVGLHKNEYAYKEFLKDLTDEEKEQYCKLLSDEFLADFEGLVDATLLDAKPGQRAGAPFEGDTTC